MRPIDEPKSIEHVISPLPDKPSIAVLPFTNISDDAKQEYFVDGLTEDLITDLSKLSGMFVIARNSVFTYKNKAVKVNQVARELGVRYVLEGSVRRDKEKIRINAQLIDATTSGHLWAERYDGKLDDIFTLQDKITLKIVTALSVNLTPGEERQRAEKYTSNVEAYDAYLQGKNLGSVYELKGFDDKIKYFEKAIELDPTYSHAHAALAAVYEAILWDERVFAIGTTKPQIRLLIEMHIEEAMKNPTPLAHRVRSKLLSNNGDWDEANVEAGKAIVLNPNDSDGYFAMSGLLIKLGRPTEAQIYLDEAMRLNPRGFYTWWLASVQFHQEQYENAVEILLDGIDKRPTLEWLYLLLGASYGHLGLDVEGKRAIQKFNELREKLGHHKDYSLGEVDYWAFKDLATRERIREGLRKSGMQQ